MGNGAGGTGGGGYRAGYGAGGYREGVCGAVRGGQGTGRGAGGMGPHCGKVLQCIVG